MNRIRNLVGALMLAAATVGMTVPVAAQADGFWNVQVNVGSRNVRHGQSHFVSDHPAHYFFDGRLYCAGKDAWGRWVSDARCEDAYGRKLVDNPSFVQSVLHGGRSNYAWRDERNWRDERSSNWRGERNWRDDRFSWSNR